MKTVPKQQQKPRFWAPERPADGKTRGSIYTAMKRAELEAVGGDNGFGVTFQLVIHR